MKVAIVCAGPVTYPTCVLVSGDLTRWIDGLLLQIEECTVNFNAKISSLSQSSIASQSSKSSTSSFSAALSLPGFSISTSATSTFSNQVTAANSNTEQRAFSISVYVKSVQDALPNGVTKILSILEDAIRMESK